MKADWQPQIEYPPGLPISERAAEVVALLRAHPVLIVAGETGSGKTTQLPKMCLQAGFGARRRIACTQPRRVAALSIARRVAEELKVDYGREVGAKIRFTDRTSPQTRIKFLTDGMLLSEVQGDRFLREYDCLVIDEAHERSLNIDFLLGYLKQLRTERPELRLVVTSATIDTQRFSAHFDNAPVVEVGGRTFPVEVRYAPLEESFGEDEALSYVEGAARAVEDLVLDNRPGDILVFLPSEKDIRETRQLLERRALGRCELLPLYGRLSNAEQQRIFSATQARKIILSTNIAETSLTLPGIRYVVDTGLARISRYAPHTRTQRLPVEAIAQSSAEQRKGRAGRVAEGTCIRLYSEKDYASRPRFTTPEILRSNLAAVILRMEAFHLGEVECFPFLDPPSERAVKAGYRLLQDLGAMDATRTLTPLGHDLARLPVDPTVGRMLLQARREGSLREVLVIAAALSIQDPRERPEQEQAQADQAHRRFRDGDSDFMTLLNLWKAFHEQMEQLTQNQLRRFCRDNYLNYQRMREWRDIHQQLSTAMEGRQERGRAEEAGPVQPKADAEYHQIHRALLTGLLTHIAEREEGNHYRGPLNRKAMLFPGSGLFDKQAAKVERKKFQGQQKPTKASGHRTPPWILCAEWVETNRLYARTVARIDVRWVLELGAHLCQSSYTDPRYDVEGERVLVRERIRLYGLEVGARWIGYARIDAARAQEIFIREALVEGQLQTQADWFVANQAVRAEIEERLTRLREGSAWQLEERVYEWYHQRLEGVGSYADLRAFAKAQHGGKTAFLRFEEADLLAQRPPEGLEALYPDHMEVAGAALDLAYTYKPGEAEDGATLRIPLNHFERVDPDALDWAVPGYLKGRVEALLKGLPKSLRRALHPIADKVEPLVAALEPGNGSLQAQLARLVQERYQVRITPEAWRGVEVPEHLRVRVEVVDAHAQPVAEGRAWESVRQQLQTVLREGRDAEEQRQREGLMLQARQRFEKEGLSRWSFADAPQSWALGEVSGLPLTAYPGLRLEAGGPALRLFAAAAEAERYTPPAWRELARRALGRDWAWFEREIQQLLQRLRWGWLGWADPDQLRGDLLAMALEDLVTPPQFLPLERGVFEAAVTQARKASRGWAQKTGDLLHPLFEARRQLYKAEATFPGYEACCQRLLHPRVLRETTRARLKHWPRYLKALELRRQRAARDPHKDARRAAQCAPYWERLRQWEGGDPAVRQTFRHLLEEFEVSLFAQELGTAEKVSEKKLEAYLEGAGADAPGLDTPATPGAQAASAVQRPDRAPTTASAAQPVASDAEDLKRAAEALKQKLTFSQLGR